MIRHFFLDKTNTIIKDSTLNLGLNPILRIGYGQGIIRGLLHFDIAEIKSLIDDKTFAKEDKLKFYLKMVNCFSVDGTPYEKNLFHQDDVTKRAASFDLILFKLPTEFDQGRGFNYESDFWIEGKKSTSYEGSNWYFAKNGIPWSLKTNFRKDDTGEWNDITPTMPTEKDAISSTEILKQEYDKFKGGQASIIVAEQHFDFGNENLSMDITDYVMKSIKTGFNYGLGLAFAPCFEEKEREFMQVVDFFTDHTNTFFHPYVEANYSEYIQDDRESFTVGRSNKLYLYVSDNGVMKNLDKLPKCTINENEAKVEQATKGVYFATVGPEISKLDSYTIYYDMWSEIECDGENEEDMEFEFVANPKARKRLIGTASMETSELEPFVYGINDDETIGKEDEREVTVSFRKKYSSEFVELTDNAEYRLYIEDGNREYDVIEWQPIEKAFLNNFFVIYAQDLIPGKYFIDIKTSIGRNKKHFKKILSFKVASNVTERYE